MYVCTRTDSDTDSQKVKQKKKNQWYIDITSRTTGGELWLQNRFKKLEIHTSSNYSNIVQKRKMENNINHLSIIYIIADHRHKKFYRKNFRKNRSKKVNKRPIDKNWRIQNNLGILFFLILLHCKLGWCVHLFHPRSAKIRDFIIIMSTRR